MGVFVGVVNKSVTDADVDVIVNASNTLLQLGSGVSGAIRVACGPGYQAVLDEVVQAHGGGLEPGEAIVTGAGKHPRARFIVHVAVMDYRPQAIQRAPDAERIRRGTRALWELVEDLPLSTVSIGMVALGAGTGNLGVRIPTVIACETLKEHLSGRESKISQVLFHGFSLIEYMNILDVVSAHFDVDLSDVPEEVRTYLAGLRGEVTP